MLNVNMEILVDKGNVLKTWFLKELSIGINGALSILLMENHGLKLLLRSKHSFAELVLELFKIFHKKILNHFRFILQHQKVNGNS